MDLFFKNTYVDGNDIIIGKVMPKKQGGIKNNQDKYLYGLMTKVILI